MEQLSLKGHCPDMSDSHSVQRKSTFFLEYKMSPLHLKKRKGKGDVLFIFLTLIIKV